MRASNLRGARARTGIRSVWTTLRGRRRDVLGRAAAATARRCWAEALESRTLLSVDQLGYHNDLSSSGLNLNESTLTLNNVGTATFGKLFTHALDGQAYAQPLVKTAVNITTGAHAGVHDVVFVATQHDSLYAFDAQTGVQLWHDSFIDPTNGVTTVPFAELTPNPDITPEVGITGTPVIDPSSNVLYLVAKTKEVRGDGTHYVQRLHAINLGDGTEAFGGPAVIADTLYDPNLGFTYVSGPSVNGTGDGSVNGVVTFNAMRELNRPGLILLNGKVYIAFGSHGDNGPYHGWVLGYDASNLQLTAAWNSTPNGGLGGIWQGGGITAVDAQGNLYFETGNGSFDENLDSNGFPSQGDYGDSFVKLTPDSSTPATQNVNGWGLKVVDYFTPQNESSLSASDTDLGSGAPTLLPDSAGSAAHPHLVIGGGKQGTLYLIDRDNMGKFDPSADHVVQSVPGAINGMLDTPAFYDGTLYIVGGYGDVAKTFSISDATVSTSPTSQSTDSYSFPGSTPSISADAADTSNPNAIVWDLDRGTNQLRAYDAAGYGNELWNSDQANTRDTLGAVVKFTVPTVANGMVYVGTSSALVAYGLLLPPTSAPATPSALTAQTISATQIDLSWELNSINASQINIERSTDGTTFTPLASVQGNSTTYSDTSAQPATHYYYQVQAANIIGASGFSNTADATTRPTINGSWTDADVGTPAIAGSASYDPASFTYTVTGSGNDIWNNADEFHFVYQQLIGDGTITARVLTQDSTDVWAKAGVMIRETPEGGSTQVVMAMTPGNGAAFQYRNQTDGGSSAAADNYAYLPEWVRLTRSGDNFTASISQDGVTWQDQGTVTIPMNTAVYAGLAVCAHNDGLLGTATFDNVSLQQNMLAPPQVPTNLAAQGASGTQIALNWTDAGHNAVTFTVQRSSDGTTYSVVGTTPKTSYIDSGLQSGHKYYYEVSASNPAGTSAFTDAVSAAPPIPPITPSNGHATLILSDEIDLAWTDNSNNENGFRIFRRLGSAGEFTLLADLPPNTISYNDNTVPPNTQVDYHIQAYNAAGYSDFTGVSTATPIGPPVGITTTPGFDQMTLSWTQVNGATGYNIYRSLTPGGEGTTPVVTVTGITFVDTGLTNGTLYYYQISTLSPTGETGLSAELAVSPGAVQGVTARYFNDSDWSGMPNVQTIDPNIDYNWGGGSPAPGIQTDNFSTEFFGKIHADVSGWYYFSSNTDDDGYLYVDGQLVSEDTGGHGQREALYYGYVNPISLVGGQDYNFIFRQIERTGDSGAHMSWEIYGDDGSYVPLTVIPSDHLTSLLDLPAQPTDLAASNVGSRSLSITFTDNSTSEFDELVERSDDGIHFTTVGDLGMQENFNGSPQTVNFSDTGLQPNTTYYYKIVAVNPEGQSESSVLPVTTNPVNPNAGLQAYFFKSQLWAGDPVVSEPVDTVDFAWGNTAPVPQINSQIYSSAFTGKVHIINEGYYYFLSNTGDDGYLYVNGSLVSSDPGAHGARDAWNGTTGIYLDPGDYSIVFLQNERGGGGGAAHLEWLAPDTGYQEQIIPNERLQRDSDLPANPTDLRFSDRTADAVTLHWTDNATNEVYYDVERSTDGINYTRVAELQPVSNPNYSGAGVGTWRDAGLSANTRYYYRVIARNFSGQSGAAQGIVLSGNASTPFPGPVVDHSNGFADAYNDLALNGYPIQPVGNVLQLTDGGLDESTSAFTYNQVPVNTFSTTFDFQLSNAAADGFTFTIQNYWPYNYASGGGDLGYGDGYFPDSLALKFDLYTPAGNHQSSTTGLYFDGNQPVEDANQIDMAPAGINLHSGHTMHVALNYDGLTLNESVTDLVTGATFVTNYTVDIPGIIQSSTAYVGFTAATGGLGAVQDILDWTYTPVAAGAAPAAPTVTGDDIAGTEGQAAAGLVAEFVPDTTVGGDLSFEASIDWGDGATSAGTIGLESDGIHYAVNGSHSYAEEGSYSVTVFVTDDRNGATDLATDTATIADADLTAFRPDGAFTTTYGVPLTGPVLIFSDANPAAAAGDYTATINWGDGSAPDSLTSAAGGITAGGPGFSVNVAHNFPHAGSYVATILVTDAGGASTRAQITVNVAPAPLVVSPASFWRFALNSNPTLTGTLTGIRNGDAITATYATLANLFSSAGAYPITATLHDPTGKLANYAVTLNTGTLTVMALTQRPVAAVEGTALSNSVLASFVDSNPAAAANDFKVTILWGDGTAPTAGSARIDPLTHVVSIVGGHLYLHPGNFSPLVTVQDTRNGAGVTATVASVRVADAPWSLTGNPVRAPQGKLTAAVLGRITDTNQYAVSGGYSVTVDWGDGSRSAASLVADPSAPGSFQIVGTHHYPAGRALTYTATVYVTDIDGSVTKSVQDYVSLV